MTLALVITAVTAYGVATSPALMTTIFTNKLLFWGLIIAELALVWGISGAINRLSLATATLMFVAYSVMNNIYPPLTFNKRKDSFLNDKKKTYKNYKDIISE